MKNVRVEQMENYIQDKHTVSLKDLANHFNVSLSTIRNDIDCLMEKGKIKKVYGGVTVVDHELIQKDYGLRKDTSFNAKAIIGQKASELVENGDIIFIDSGTTTIHMVEHLINKKDIKIVTNNLMVINYVIDNSDIEVIGLGGIVRSKTKSFVGIEGLRLLEQYNIQKAFMASSAINIPAGVTNSFYAEKIIKEAVVKRAQQVCLLCDSSKFGRAALLTYCNLSDIDILVTDDINNDYITDLINNGVKKII